VSDINEAVENRLLLQSSPHLRDQDSVHKVMHTVVLALLPAAVAGVVFFGVRALAVMAVSVVACLAFEAAALKIGGKPIKPHITDGSAIITGLLLAMNLPSGIPIWMVVIGALVAMVLGKHAYGGVGNNPFNPALVARVFLLISFPTALTSWPTPAFGPEGLDAITTATPLGLLQMLGKGGEEAVLASSALEKMDHWMLVLGNVKGCIGEVSAAALIVGGVFLLVRKVITWEIPVSFIGTVAAFTLVAWLVDGNMGNPIYHVLSGGVMLGAWFMATDMVTSPVSRKGMLVFGIGCGLLTCVIRMWAGYPEGVSFAILIMNGLVPLIDRYVKSPGFGDSSVQEGA